MSTVTIRNDLEFLEQKGTIHRTYGGALLRNSVYNDPSLEEKQNLHAEEKKRIGIEAAQMISDGDTILLDSGTTTREIAMQIKERKKLSLIRASSKSHDTPISWQRCSFLCEQKRTQKITVWGFLRLAALRCS